jgi:putative ABC transport system substrate-binding protein
MGKSAAREKVELVPIEVAAAADFDEALGAAPGASIGGFVSTDQVPFLTGAERIAEIARKRRLPSIGSPIYAAQGGLAGYGPDFGAMARRAAHFVDRILRGASPGDLPIEQATRFLRVINLKTAAAIGFEIPPSALAAADQVIE